MRDDDGNRVAASLGAVNQGIVPGSIGCLLNGLLDEGVRVSSVPEMLRHLRAVVVEFLSSVEHRRRTLRN